MVVRASEVSVGETPSLADVLPGRRVALFDLDRTLLPGSSLTCFARTLVRSGYLPAPVLARALLQEVCFSRRGTTDAGVARLRARLLSMAAGRRYDDLLAVIARAAADVAGRVYPDA